MKAKEFPKVSLLPPRAVRDGDEIIGLSVYTGDQVGIGMPERVQWDFSVYAMDNNEDTDAVFVRKTVNLLTLQTVNWLLDEEIGKYDDESYASRIEEYLRVYHE